MRLVIFMLVCGASMVGAQSSPVGQTRSTLQEWVLTEKTISAEREAWQAEKATVVDLIRLLRDEQALLDERQKEAEAVTTQAEARRGKLLEDKEALQDATVALEDDIAEFEAALLELAPRLPTPLSKKVHPLVSRLPEPGKPTKLSVGQRAQNIVGILGEIDKFNREITLDTQIQTLPDGRSVEVRVLWLGLGSAYYSDVAGRNAGIMQVTEEGWVLVSQPELSESINRVIAQYERNEPAAFVSLPLEIR